MKNSCLNSVNLFQASENAGFKTGFDGPKLYIFDQSLTSKLHKPYDFIRPGKEDKEQQDVDNMVGKLDCKYMCLFRMSGNVSVWS